MNSSSLRSPRLCVLYLAALTSLAGAPAAAQPPPGEAPAHKTRLRPVTKGRVMNRPDLRTLPPGAHPARPGLLRRGPNGALMPVAPARNSERLTRLVERQDLGKRMKIMEAVHARQGRANAHRHEVMESLLARAHGRPLRPMPEELRLELLKHARRQALLARIALLADVDKDEKVIAKATTLQAAEAARHERRLTILFGDPTNAPPEEQNALREKQQAAAEPAAKAGAQAKAHPEKKERKDEAAPPAPANEDAKEQP